MTQTDAPAFVYNPFTADYIQDPYPYYKEMRQKDPVHEHPLGFWILAKHADLREVMRAEHSVEDRYEDTTPFKELRKAGVGGVDFRSVLDRSVLNLDPPDHTRLRRLMTYAFNARSILAQRDRMTELVDDALNRMADAGRADIVRDYAYPMAFTMICDLLGMPDTDLSSLRPLLEVIVRLAEPSVDQGMLAKIAKADQEMSERIAEVIDIKRREPDNSLLSGMIQAEHEGDRLTEEELISQVATLYLAGYESTINLISNGVLNLLRDREQFELLAGRPDLDANAVEEFLRYDASVQQVRRITLTPQVIGGKEIPANAFVLGLVGSANRDEDFFGPDAGDLRVDRPNAGEHISFGERAHYCIGASLARVQAQLAVGRLIRRFPRMALDGEVTWKTRITVRAANAVHVTVS